MTDDELSVDTWEFRVRVTHSDVESARRMIEGNALDDPFGLVSVEELLWSLSGETDEDDDE